MQSHEGTYCARSSPRVDPIYQHIGTWKQAGTCQVSKSISSSPFFHPRPQFSRFKARTWLHNLIGERINNSNNQMNSFDQEASKKRLRMLSPVDWSQCQGQCQWLCLLIVLSKCTKGEKE